MGHTVRSKTIRIGEDTAYRVVYMARSFVFFLQQTSLPEMAKEQLPKQLTEETARQLELIGRIGAEKILKTVIGKINCGSTETIENLVMYEIEKQSF